MDDIPESQKMCVKVLGASKSGDACILNGMEIIMRFTSGRGSVTLRYLFPKDKFK